MSEVKVNKLNTRTNTALTIQQNSTTAMTIDTSQNVLVGKTDTTFATAGVNLQPNGRVDITRDGGQSVYFNRTTSDGDIAGFYKDGTQVGSIYNGGGNLGVNSSGGLLLVDDIITPTSGADNTKDIGRSSARWKDAYIGGNIYLGGTGSANALDDYEEGTWTPSTDHGTLTTSYAKYTKIGNRVFVSCTVNSVSDTTNSNPFLIRGLPFTNSGEVSNGIMGRFFSASNSGDALIQYIENNASHIQLWVTAHNSSYDRLSHSELTSTSANFYINISYTT
jgi:hypothetical protein